MTVKFLIALALVSWNTSFAAQQEEADTSQFLLSLSESLLFENLAEVDIDPKVFDLVPEDPKKSRKDDLDEIEFASETERKKRA